jgi:hypothetical protein
VHERNQFDQTDDLVVVDHGEVVERILIIPGNDGGYGFLGMARAQSGPFGRYEPDRESLLKCP